MEKCYSIKVWEGEVGLHSKPIKRKILKSGIVLKGFEEWL